MVKISGSFGGEEWEFEEKDSNASNLIKKLSFYNEDEGVYFTEHHEDVVRFTMKCLSVSLPTIKKPVSKEYDHLLSNYIDKEIYDKLLDKTFLVAVLDFAHYIQYNELEDLCCAKIAEDVILYGKDIILQYP